MWIDFPSMNPPAKPPRKIWFPAKTYGWGWGLPLCWQGWVVMGVYLAAMAAILAALPGPKHIHAKLACVFGLSLLLVAICWWKGEKPEWRWGEKPHDPEAD